VTSLALQQAASPAPVPKVLALWTMACCAGALAVSLSWWALLAGGGDSSRTIVIEPGTAEAIARGYPVSQPSNIDLEPGGAITITNHDSVEHYVGWLRLAPGETGVLTAPASASRDLEYGCSIHPGGRLGVSLQSRPIFWQALAGGLAAGVAVGVVATGVTLIARRLDAD